MKKTLTHVAALILGASLVVLFMTRSAPGQDTAKVAADTTKVILENDRVRVLETRLKPGAKMAMHSHPGNVMYAVAGGKMKFTMPDGKSEEKELKTGVAVWSDAVTHAVENTGTTEILGLNIELKDAAAKAEKKAP